MHASNCHAPTIDVLLVEDDDSHAKLIQRAFVSSGMPVKLRFARDIRSMRSEIDSKRPDFLILDYLLPDGRGLDAISEEAWPVELPTVVITSFAHETLAWETGNIKLRQILEKSQVGFGALPGLVRNEFYH